MHEAVMQALERGAHAQEESERLGQALRALRDESRRVIATIQARRGDDPPPAER